jgi:hypothetical protein
MYAGNFHIGGPFHTMMLPHQLGALDDAIELGVVDTNNETQTPVNG